jgi:hypothetical protein
LRSLSRCWILLVPDIKPTGAKNLRADQPPRSAFMRDIVRIPLNPFSVRNNGVPFEA